MDITFAAVLFGLMGAAAWGTSDFLIGKASRSVGPLQGALLVNIAGAVAFGIVYLLLFAKNATFSLEGVAFAVAGGIFFGLAQLSFFKAMHLGPVSLVSSVSSTYPLITLLVSITVFAAHLTALQLLGVVLVVAGVMVASGAFPTKKGAQHVGPGPLLAIVPAICWGLGWTLVSQAVIRMPWQSSLLVELFVTALMLCILVIATRGEKRLSMKSLRQGWKRPLIWSTAVVQTIGMLCVYLGVDAVPGGVAVVVAVSSCYPVLTIFLALRHLQERVPILPLAGGVVGVVGVVVLSLGG